MNKRCALKNSRLGFTLIELLVVIAIIGLLSAVVLLSVDTARAKAKDTEIKGTLHTIITQSKLDYEFNSASYGTQAWTANATSFTPGVGGPGASIFFTDSIVGQGMVSVASYGGKISYGAAADSWVIVSSLNNGGYWCVDSHGISKAEVTAPTGTNNYTSGTTFGCI